MIQRNFVVFTASAFLFLIVFFTSSLIANQENPDKPSIKRSNPQSEISNPPSVNSNPSNLQSTIQNLSSTSIGEPKFEKADVLQKTEKLQIPFIANEGQTNERVKFYANTFGGTVFVTKDGEIVYSLPNNSSDVETQCLASLMHSPNGIRDEVGMLHDYYVSDIMHPASWIVGRGSKFAIQNLSSTSIGEPKSGVALKEQFVGAKVKTIQGEDPSVTKVNYFKGSDPSKWKTDISTYDMVNLGEIYKGVELKLKAYGNNVEKLFCVKPGADPSQIKVSLSGIQPSENPPPLSPSVMGTGGCPPLAGAGGGLGARGLSVNERGELEVETKLGPVKFTKPVAYQEINGKRVEIECGYVIADCGMQNEAGSRKQEAGSKKVEARSKKYALLNPKSAIKNPKSKHLQFAIRNPKSEIDSLATRHSSPTYGFTVASYDKTKDLIIDPLLTSTYLGPGTDYNYSIAIDSSGNIYVTGTVLSSSFPTTSGAYDTSASSGYYDAFISKLSADLKSLLASTFLGGSSSDSGQSIAIDSGGNICVTGYTNSKDFPTTISSYDNSYNGGEWDVFVSKLNGSLTSLIASTFLGGSGSDYSHSLDLDSSGNVYVAGETVSTDFPTTTGAYDTSNYYDAFISKLNGDLTSLLASTFLGGSGSEYLNSIAIDSSGNAYVTGYTSRDFPITSGAYDTSYNDSGYYDIFISKLNNSLTSLLASTYLGGSSSDHGNSITIDASGNVYVAGYTASSDFPTTFGAYDTSFNVNSSNFISKLNGNLTDLIASTYLGRSLYDGSGFITIDASGNVYVTGQTDTFPTTAGAYNTSYNGGADAFVSKLNGNLTSLLASTYLGGSSRDYGMFIVLDSSKNIYVTGYTESSDFPTTTGVYDNSFNGHRDVFISKFDNDLSASSPTVATDSATDISLTSATLNGTVNANGQSTTAWFQYGPASGSYSNTSSTQTVNGTNDINVSIDITGLSPSVTYYYRIAAQNSVGTAYGSEMLFTTLSDAEAPAGSININSNATYTNSPTVTLSLSSTDNLGVTGYYLSTSSATPSASDTGWTSVTSTNSYGSNVSYTLSSGDGNKTVYVWYKDNSGNVSSSASDSIILDTTTPVITISSPTSNTTYTVTSSVIAIGGNASDSTSGISSVTWSNDKGGSGTASGTTSWLTSSISLLSGNNIITVTAKDGAGNSGTDTLQVTYSPSGTVSVPAASTGSATNITSSTATLNGTVNANGASTTVWFQYGTDSGSYGNTSSSQVVSGSSNTTVSISISSLSSNTTYYYRVVASNSAGTSYGSEASFATKTVSTTPTPTTSPAPTLSPLPTPVASPSPAPTLPPLPTPIPTLTPEPNEKGTISGYIVNKKGYPIESAKIRLKGTNSKVFRKTISDEDGLFEFTDLDADTYTITALKKGYKTVKQTITLEAGEEVDIEIVIKKISRRGIMRFEY